MAYARATDVDAVLDEAVVADLDTDFDVAADACEVTSTEMLNAKTVAHTMLANILYIECVREDFI